MHKFSLTTCFYLIFSLSLNAQIHDLHKYLNNIVELGGGEFGLITGSDNDNVFFITASQNGEFATINQIHSYKSKQINEVTFIKKFQIDDYFIFLFAFKKGKNLSWENYSYASINNSKSFYSFLDNGKVDSTWFVNNSELVKNDQHSKNIVQLKVPRDDKFYPGFPVVDDANNIVGIIADEQQEAEENTSTLFNTIDIEVIQQKLYAYSGCKYFQLIKAGQAATPCDIEHKIKQQQIMQIKKARADNQIYKIAFGPALDTYLSIGGGPKAGITALGVSGGIDLFINPDKGKFGITLKPRISYVPFNISSDNFTDISTIGYTLKKIRFEEVNMGVMFEFVTKKESSTIEDYIGFGYIPTYQFPIRYQYTTSDNSAKRINSEESTKGFKNKVAFESGIRKGNLNLNLIVAYQFSWNDINYSTVIENELIYPTTSYGKNYFQFGVDLSFRLKGKWGLKSN